MREAKAKMAVEFCDRLAERHALSDFALESDLLTD